MTNGTSEPMYLDFKPSLGNVRDTVIHGLEQNQKKLPPWLLYDEKGSNLFEDICETDTYYVTRTELGILDDMNTISEFLPDSLTIVQFGTGSGIKTKKLLALLPKVVNYVCIDISFEALQMTVERLKESFPDLPVTAICANYNDLKELPVDTGDSKRLMYFPGSTIGNLEPEQQSTFLDMARSLMRPDDYFVIGIDLQKPVDVLKQAYDDPGGVTAAFNLNLLDRLNREVEANFDVNEFNHTIRYDSEKHRIEMHLESQREQQVKIGDQTFKFEKGETIHTESSHKFNCLRFRDLVQGSQFEPVEKWKDDKQWFSIELLRAVDANAQ